MVRRQIFFDEELGKAKEKLAKEEKRKRRAREEFQHLLRDTRRIKHDTTWADAKALLDKEPEYKSVRPCMSLQLKSLAGSCCCVRGYLG